ncbi:hypothetical protein PIB30_042595 [Stylosanthes scabra]|uniref:Uncharacterized protein n=1 Tax=Stylosanthes scabra TaxID=79078 RepID=A0ABU6UDX6_9FABA|nr:hypothetical protein [Stylosanthes scabra]
MEPHNVAKDHDFWFGATTESSTTELLNNSRCCLSHLTRVRHPLFGLDLGRVSGLATGRKLVSFFDSSQRHPLPIPNLSSLSQVPTEITPNQSFTRSLSPLHLTHRRVIAEHNGYRRSPLPRPRVPLYESLLAPTASSAVAKLCVRPPLLAGSLPLQRNLVLPNAVK